MRVHFQIAIDWTCSVEHKHRSVSLAKVVLDFFFLNKFMQMTVWQLRSGFPIHFTDINDLAQTIATALSTETGCNEYLKLYQVLKRLCRNSMMDAKSYATEHLWKILANSVTSFKNDTKNISFITEVPNMEQNSITFTREKIMEMRKQRAILRNFSLFSNSLQVFTSTLVFILFFKKSKLRTNSNMYAFHIFLSIFGNGIGGLCHRLPLVLGDDVNFLSNTACLVLLSITRFFYTTTLMFVAAVALNRLFAICFPRKRFLSGKWHIKVFPTTCTINLGFYKIEFMWRIRTNWSKYAACTYCVFGSHLIFPK